MRIAVTVAARLSWGSPARSLALVCTTVVPGGRRIGAEAPSDPRHEPTVPHPTPTTPAPSDRLSRRTSATRMGTSRPVAIVGFPVRAGGGGGGGHVERQIKIILEGHSFVSILALPASSHPSPHGRARP